MKKRLIFVFLLVIFTFNGILNAMEDYRLPLNPNKKKLPTYKTKEEKLLAKERNKINFYAANSAPTGNVYTPAEFAKMEGVLMTVIYEDTANKKYYAEMIKAVISSGATPYLLVDGTNEKNTVTQSVLNTYGINASDVEFLIYPYDANWSRDYGPWHIYENNIRAIVDMEYYPDRPLDDAIPVKLGTLWKDKVYTTGFATEGGNFMTDGLGTCWQSTVVFEWNDESESQINQMFKNYLGCNNTYYPTSIPNEGTQHIDMYSKILNQDTIIVSYSKSEWGAKSNEITALENAAKFYENTAKPDGGKWNIVRIPMTFSGSGEDRTYYTHTNSLIVNDHVLVPIYSKGTDEEALNIYKKLMPNHTIVGINANIMIPYGGSIHCTTMQIPVKSYAACGDGVIKDGEECEFNYLKGATCQSLGYAAGTLKCNNCMFDKSGCTGANNCGNNKVDNEELCDGNTIACSEIEGKNYIGGTAQCLANCSGWNEQNCEEAQVDNCTTISLEELIYHGKLSDGDGCSYTAGYKPNTGTTSQDQLIIEFRTNNQNTGSFDLSQEYNANYSTCSQCILIAEDLDQENKAAKLYFQESGTLVIDEFASKDGYVSDKSRGKINNVKLVEVTIAQDGKSSPVANGSCLYIENVSWNTISDEETDENSIATKDEDQATKTDSDISTQDNNAKTDENNIITHDEDKSSSVKDRNETSKMDNDEEPVDESACSCSLIL